MRFHAAFAGIALLGVYAVAAEPDAKPTPASPAPKPSEVKSLTAAEHAAFLQRLAFCTKLRQIAATSNDDALAAKADRLETQATELYALKLKQADALLADAKFKESKQAMKKQDMAKAVEVVGFAPNGRPIRGAEAKK